MILAHHHSFRGSSEDQESALRNSLGYAFGGSEIGKNGVEHRFYPWNRDEPARVELT